MTVVIPAPPAAVPQCEPQPSGRSFVSGVRTAAVGASDCASVMRASSAPEGWEGDAAEVADHAMTSTADGLDGAVAAMQAVAAAGDTFFDRLDGLLARRDRVVDRRAEVEADRQDFAARAASYDVETEEEGLLSEAAALSARLESLHDDVVTWSEDLASAEDDFVSALRGSDTVAEGSDLALRAPDTRALADRLAELSDDPEALSSWWAGLTPEQREALKIAHPGLVGGADGLPTVDRDETNRASLSEDLNTLRQREGDGDLSDDDRARLDRLEGIYAAMALAEEQGVIDLSTGEPVQPYLMLYRPDAGLGDGTAALAWGDPDHADHVSVNVPGFSSTLDNFDGVSGDALSVFDRAQDEGTGSVASVAWLGYNAPDFAQWDNPLGLADGANVGNELSARAGAGELSDFIDGLRASDQGDQAHVTAIGHSYGSTTVAKASGDALDADNTVLVGSPGAGAGNDRASDLSGDVYVGSADSDFVTRLGNPTVGGLGNDPAGSDFGATRFPAADVSDGAFDIDNHTAYFDPGSTSLGNISRVVAGNGDEVDQIEGRDGAETPRWWVDQTAGRAADGLIDKGGDLVDGARDRLDTARDLLEHVPVLTPQMPRVGWPF